MDTATAPARAVFRRRLLILLLLILLVLLLGFFFAQGPPPPTLARTITPVQPNPQPSFSPTVTRLPPDLFTEEVIYVTRIVFLETHTFVPSGSPTRTSTPEAGPSQTFTPRPAACSGHGFDHGATWLVAGCDNLSLISRRTGIPLADLLAANPWITNPNLIYPGQVVTLPGR